MPMLTLVAMLIVAVAIISTVVSERVRPELRPVRVKVRREGDDE